MMDMAAFVACFKLAEVAFDYPISLAAVCKDDETKVVPSSSRPLAGSQEIIRALLRGKSAG